MVGLVGTMMNPSTGLRAAQGLAQGKTPHEQESLQRQIAATDKQIDNLVYELYGLTNDEIRIVEGERE